MAEHPRAAGVGQRDDARAGNHNNAHAEFSLAALRSGDKTEFARLVDKYSGPIYRLAFKILGDAQDAEDVLQETFLKAFRALRDFEGRSRISTWLYRIAANEAFMALRRRKPDAVSMDEPQSTSDGEQEPVQVVDWCCLPEEELLSAEARDHLDKAIDRLTPALKAVFLLRDIEGMSVRETAEALNLSEAAVKTRLLRARLHLREYLSAYYTERVAAQAIYADEPPATAKQLEKPA
ncbi:MAG: sigma-70 family RNA polymerase sigma factor [Anaerolineae bacterium]|nr:sigma-70 family RNA polymerase sigma factor [Thermoflexales bacterium]MDW8407626.1 sigma-70 family RNA polymerase sigma factor [Anaerolineae bacterium]